MSLFEAWPGLFVFLQKEKHKSLIRITEVFSPYIASKIGQHNKTMFRNRERERKRERRKNKTPVIIVETFPP